MPVTTPPPPLFRSPDPSTPCPVCGAKRWSGHVAGVVDYITDERFDLLCCGECGLVVTHPLPAGAEMDRYYPPRYRTDRQKHTGSWRVRRRAAMLQRHFAPGYRGRVLDIGCGTGAFAMEMQRRGWSVSVTELNDAVLEEMRGRGMDAKRPDEAMRDGFAAPFDAITAWHVLEHVPEPVELAKWSAQRLTPRGVFQATVPNLASFQAREFGRRWFHLDVPRHAYHFTPQTLRGVLDPAGLRVVALSTLALEYDLFGVIQSALNVVCRRPNVLFEQITTRQGLEQAPRRDSVISWALFPALLALGLAHVTFAALHRKGATLTVTCRRVSPPP
jgi:SAM-dependent methyltransferase